MVKPAYMAISRQNKLTEKRINRDNSRGDFTNINNVFNDLPYKHHTLPLILAIYKYIYCVNLY